MWQPTKPETIRICIVINPDVNNLLHEGILESGPFDRYIFVHTDVDLLDRLALQLEAAAREVVIRDKLDNLSQLIPLEIPGMRCDVTVKCY